MKVVSMSQAGDEVGNLEVGIRLSLVAQKWVIYR